MPAPTGIIWLSLNLASPALTPPAADVHPALARYPSPQELQHRIDAAKTDNSQSYWGARADFDLAIRSLFTLGAEAPAIPGRPLLVPHVLPKGPQLTSLETTCREATERSIERWQSMPGGQDRAQFFRDHMEDYSVDNTPSLRVVLADVLLNGWSDWAGWELERLNEVRTLYADVHRVYALDLARYFRIDDYTGVVLRMLADPALPDYLRRRAEGFVTRLGKGTDVVDFLVKEALSTSDDVVSSSFRSCIGAVSRASGHYERRSYWKPFLDHPDAGLRGQAVSEINSSTESIRWLTFGEDTSPDLIAKLEEIAAHDPDEIVRRDARMLRMGRERQLARERETGKTPESRSALLQVGPPALEPSHEPSPRISEVGSVFESLAVFGVVCALVVTLLGVR